MNDFYSISSLSRADLFSPLKETPLLRGELVISKEVAVSKRRAK
jgi:hypothetical protein